MWDFEVKQIQSEIFKGTYLCGKVDTDWTAINVDLCWNKRK